MNPQTLVQNLQQHSTAALATVSMSSGLASFIVKTFPYVQYTAAIIGVISGVLAILLAIKKLRE